MISHGTYALVSTAEMLFAAWLVSHDERGPRFFGALLIALNAELAYSWARFDKSLLWGFFP